MIELIVWLFEQLFGNQEPTARVGPRRGSRSRSRGGGGGGGYGPSGGERPKTLAELLEEARAELDGGGRTEPQRQVSHDTPEATTARVEEPAQQEMYGFPTVSSPPEHEQQPQPVARRDVPSAPPSAIPPPPAVVPKVRASRKDQVRKKATPSKKAKRAKKAARVQIADVTTPSPAKRPEASTAHRGLESWVSAMQSDKPQMKHQAALIAVIGGVVLGPPKCRQRR